MGAAFLALKYSIRRPTKLPVPDTISPAVFKTKVLHTTHGEVVYHEAGTGQPLVFLHNVCVGGSSYEWSKVYPEFANAYRVLAPDFIGFGESARPKKEMYAEDSVRTLAEFIRATCEQPAVLIGSGLGAGFAVLLAVQYPDLVSRLILMMPTGLTEFGQAHLSFTTRFVSSIPVLNRFIYRNYQATKNSIRSWLMNYGFADGTRVTDEMVDVFTTCAQQYGAENSVLSYYSGRSSFDLESKIQQVRQPLTLLWSEGAAFPPQEWGSRLHQLASGSKLRVVEKAGLLAALEAPHQVAALVRQDLEAS
jgi:pimeloyl-ACP methyl ester carboxylesterase